MEIDMFTLVMIILVSGFCGMVFVEAIGQTPVQDRVLDSVCNTTYGDGYHFKDSHFVTENKITCVKEDKINCVKSFQDEIKIID